MAGASYLANKYDTKDPDEAYVKYIMHCGFSSEKEMQDYIHKRYSYSVRKEPVRIFKIEVVD